MPLSVHGMKKGNPSLPHDLFLNPNDCKRFVHLKLKDKGQGQYCVLGDQREPFTAMLLLVAQRKGAWTGSYSAQAAVRRLPGPYLQATGRLWVVPSHPL